ncbi:MAG: dUTP diphosphatase [Clostridia bacterium]|nr:dUTP diphosphatase [Clostridia bacterium]
MQIRYKKLRPDAKAPVYGTEGSAGADLFACLDEPLDIAPGATGRVPFGIAVDNPAGYVGLIFGRSGIALKRNLAPSNKVGVIDSDYRGELIAALHNHGAEVSRVEPGERVAQLVVVPCVAASFIEAEALNETGRGTGGFGSTGR